MFSNIPVINLKRIIMIFIALILITTSVPAGIDPNSDVANTQPASTIVTLPPLPESIITNYPDLEPSNFQPMTYAPDYNDVLVVYNDNSPISIQIAQYFQSQRNIPQAHMCNISTLINEEINRATFDDLRSQIETFIQNNGLTIIINYIVTTKGVPLKITGGGDSYASVDAELTMILGVYSQYIGNWRTFPNTYYGSWRDFTKEYYDIYLVTRLTGYDFNDVKSLIDNATNSYGQQGNFVFDFDPTKEGNGGTRARNDRLENAHAILTNKGYNSKLHTGGPFLIDESNVAGYASWGSRDGQYFSPAVTSNTGLETDTSPADGIPDGWNEFEDPNGTVSMDDTETRGSWSSWSVKIARNESNENYSSLYQNITIRPDIRYYMLGFIKFIGVSGDLGGHLQIKAYDGANQLVQTLNGSARTGTTDRWHRLNDVSFDPIAGVTKVSIAIVLAKSSGTVYFDDVGLYEVKPHNTWVPGALAETFTYYSAWTFTYPPYARYSSFIADLIHEGVTGASGYVYYEGSRYLHPDLLFNRYTEGYTLAESFYAASDYLGFTEIVVGDPKVRPYFGLLPDLSLETDDISFDTPFPNHGENVEISAKIHNVGGRLASNVNITFYLGQPGSGDVIGSQVFSSIDKDGTKTAKINWNTSQFSAGDHDIYVKIDPGDAIREINETNNIANISIHVNALPKLINLEFEDTSVYRTNSIMIYTNASDSETVSNLIDAELHYKPSSWGDDDLNWTNLTTRVYNSVEERWEFSFGPEADWAIGYYSFRIRFIDMDNGVSNWYQYKKAVNVKNNVPTIEKVWVSEENITRLEKLTIFIEGNDVEDLNKLEVKVQYRHSLQGTANWNTIDPGNISNPQGTNTQWEAYIQLNTSVKLGLYDLTIEITDQDNKMVSMAIEEVFNIINIDPEMDAITFSATEVYRTNTIYIYIDAEDTEDSGGDLQCELQYAYVAAPQEGDWDELYIADIHWEPQAKVIQARFHPTPSAVLGLYKVRARVSDRDSAWSPWNFADESIEVKNNVPTIVMEDVPDTVYEDEEISFDASKSTDIESKLLYFIWDFDDGSQLSAEKQASHTYTAKGLYDLNLTVEDQDGGSSTINKTIVVLNVKPVADGYSNIQSAFVGQEVTFYAEKSYDTASDTNNLTYIWDFDDGSPLEEGKVVTHTFTTATRYFITLTVKDGDEDESEKDTIMLVVENAPEGDGEGSEPTDRGFDIATLGIILIVIVIIIAIAVLFVWLRKKKAAERKIEEAVAPKPYAGLEEPDVIIRPGTVASSRTTPEIEVAPTPTVAMQEAPTGFEQLEGIPSETAALPPAGGLGTLPPEHPKRPTQKAEPEVITPDIEFAPEIPSQQEPVVKDSGALKGKGAVEVLIPEELSPTTPIGQVPEAPAKPEPKKKVKKTVPKVKK